MCGHERYVLLLSGSRPTPKRAAVTTAPGCDPYVIPTMYLIDQFTYYLSWSIVHPKLVVSATI